MRAGAAPEKAQLEMEERAGQWRLAVQRTRGDSAEAAARRRLRGRSNEVPPAWSPWRVGKAGTTDPKGMDIAGGLT